MNDVKINKDIDDVNCTHERNRNMMYSCPTTVAIFVALDLLSTKCRFMDAY